MSDAARPWFEALAFVVDKLPKGKLDKLEREGTEFVNDALASLPSNPGSDTARHAAVRKHRTELSRVGLAAYDAARFVAVALDGIRQGTANPDELWPRMMLIGHALQGDYKSWEQFEAAYDLGRAVFAGGYAKPIERTRPSIPWKTDLQIAGPKARPRYRRAKCAHCGGIKEKPSETAYVYCDFCGELCDYDYERAKQAAPSTEMPDRDALERQLDRARQDDDRAAYRKLQAKQYAHFASAAPAMTSPRIADPKYRDAWIAYMADAITAYVFDVEAMRLDAEFHARCGEVTFVEVKQKTKIVPATFPPVIDAFEARLARLEKLYSDQGILARHPDELTTAIWRRIEHAMFAQLWLPMLDENTVQAMLERLGLAAVFDAAPHGKRTKLPCHQCGVELEIVAGARRVTCEHCGHTG